MKSHYRQTLDFTDAALREAKSELDRFYRALEKNQDMATALDIPDAVLQFLCDDLNTPGAIAGLHELANAALAGDAAAAARLRAAGTVLGLFNHTADEWFRGGMNHSAVEALVENRILARRQKDFAESDRLRDVLRNVHGVIIEDGPGGTYSLRII